MLHACLLLSLLKHTKVCPQTRGSLPTPVPVTGAYALCRVEVRCALVSIVVCTRRDNGVCCAACCPIYNDTS